MQHSLYITLHKWLFKVAYVENFNITVGGTWKTWQQNILQNKTQEPSPQDPPVPISIVTDNKQLWL